MKNLRVKIKCQFIQYKETALQKLNAKFKSCPTLKYANTQSKCNFTGSNVVLLHTKMFNWIEKVIFKTS